MRETRTIMWHRFSTCACCAALGAGVLLWAALFVLPLVGLYVLPDAVNPPAGASVNLMAPAARSAGLAGVIAMLAVLLGYLPGKLLGTIDTLTATGRRRQCILLFLLLSGLLLPPYVLWYAWRLLLSPTTALGDFLSSRIDLARTADTIVTTGAMMTWHWPIAALLIAHGWRSVDAAAIESSHLDAGTTRRWWHVTLPLLARPIALAFAVCFVLAMSEFTTFHLSGIATIGTELYALYAQTQSDHLVAMAAWPMLLPAAAVAVAMWHRFSTCASGRSSESSDGWAGQGRIAAGRGGRIMQWSFVLAMVALTSIAPLVLLGWSLMDSSPIRQFLSLHTDELEWTGLSAVAAAGLSLIVAAVTLAVHRRGTVAGRWRPIATVLSACMFILVMLAMFLPASMVAAGLLKVLAVTHAPMSLRHSWITVSAGLAMRYSGLALLVLGFHRETISRQLSELAATDGATRRATWWHVHLPLGWPLLLGAAMLIVMFCMTEIPSTITLLPPGVPSFPMMLLNQMHYARDQQVIASCMLLIGTYMVLAAIVVAMLTTVGRRKLVLLPIMLCLALAGCQDKSTAPPDVKGSFGRTGTGQGEFTYPRAIDICPDGTLWVADKTGRIQHLSPDGTYIGGFSMPLFDSGKPTGITVGPDGNLYVADTHYHRVIVFDQKGNEVRRWGQYGKDDGCFIYPTDIAFIGEGSSARVLVSEYGGNDRVSIYTPDGRFLGNFGSLGSGEGQFSRPAAMVVDPQRQRLYIADACNHRIAIYDLNCKLVGYFGEAGTAPGQLRYPYGLALMGDGNLAVCEFGNNRVQVFSPDGKNLRTLGQAGRELGQLAYPWGLAVDSRNRMYVVDAGNNRVQIWQF